MRASLTAVLLALLSLVAPDQRVVRATPEHPFYVAGAGWVAASALQPGDRVRTADGEQLEVADVAWSVHDAPVYNLTVEELHTYFVGDEAVWVHNGCGNPLRQALRAAEDAGPTIDHLRTTGKLRGHFMTKAEATNNEWEASKSVASKLPGRAIGGDVFANSAGTLPNAAGRTWYEADIGLQVTGKRGVSRLLYSFDGELWVTADHYQTFHPIGVWQ